MILVKNLSIVIPVYNENDNIRKLIPLISKYIKSNNNEIIIIDDKSNDNISCTAKILKKKNFNNLKLIIRESAHKDLSQSCILGFENAKYNKILVMDGDMQHHPRFIFGLYKKFIKDECDIVIGSRKFNSSNSMPKFRKIISRFINLIINFFFGKNISDPLSGFFIFKKEIYYENKKRLFAKGYKILLDLIYSSNKKLKIKEKEIVFYKRHYGQSKINIKVIIYFFLFFIKRMTN
jgi:dolichol-phosphate mannosyltransferase